MVVEYGHDYTPHEDSCNLQYLRARFIKDTYKGSLGDLRSHHTGNMVDSLTSFADGEGNSERLLYKYMSLQFHPTLRD